VAGVALVSRQKGPCERPCTYSRLSPLLSGVSNGQSECHAPPGLNGCHAPPGLNGCHAPPGLNGCLAPPGLNGPRPSVVPSVPRCKSRASRWLHTHGDPAWGTQGDRFDPDRVERAAQWLGRLFEPGAAFPVEMQGLENLTDSPALLVSNHSGGSTVLDCLGFAYAWYQHFGGARPLHFLAHEILLATRLTGPFFDQVGVLRTSRQVAHQALAEWKRDIIVMPGGDRDTWRPWSERHNVRFSGHTGYARLALQTGVPAVPVAHCGPHDTLVIITDGKRIAERLRLHELFRIDVFPIHLSLPWGIGIGPWPHLPWPTPFRYRVGAPVPLPVPRDPSPSDEMVAAYDEKVRSALQNLLNGLAAEPHRRRMSWPRARARLANLHRRHLAPLPAVHHRQPHKPEPEHSQPRTGDQDRAAEQLLLEAAE